MIVQGAQFIVAGPAIITHFYKILFDRYPVFKTMFKEENVRNGSQVNLNHCKQKDLNYHKDRNIIVQV